MGLIVYKTENYYVEYSGLGTLYFIIDKSNKQKVDSTHYRQYAEDLCREWEKSGSG